MCLCVCFTHKESPLLARRLDSKSSSEVLEASVLKLNERTDLLDCMEEGRLSMELSSLEFSSGRWTILWSLEWEGVLVLTSIWVLGRSFCWLPSTPLPPLSVEFYEGGGGGAAPSPPQSSGSVSSVVVLPLSGLARTLEVGVEWCYCSEISVWI